MKALITMIAVLVVLGFPLNIDQGALRNDTSGIAFEGTVLQIGPQTGLSGIFVFYRLARYRVDRVCVGRYGKSEIVLGHLSLTGEEPEGINVGDRVWVTAVRSDERIQGYLAAGKGEPPVDVTYAAGIVSKTELPWCAGH